jgi:hypothetical protein
MYNKQPHKSQPPRLATRMLGPGTARHLQAAAAIVIIATTPREEPVIVARRATWNCHRHGACRPPALGCFLNNATDSWYSDSHRQPASTNPESWTCPMNAILVAKSRWRVVFIVAAVACLPASKSKPDEAVKAAPAIADSMVGKKPGQVRDDNGLKMKLVWCPPGNVTMEQVEIVEEAVTTEDEDEAAPKTRRVEKITPVRVLLSRSY